MKLLEVQSTKEFASTFLNDIFLKMAVNRVLDAAPEFNLVHCKECKDCIAGYCAAEIDGIVRLRAVKDDDFCSYGERKTE